MQYCYPEDCGPFAVAPVLVTSSYPTRCEESPTCYPCLPHCPQSMVYCCDTRPKTPLRRSSCCDSKEFDSRNRNRNHSPPRQNRNSPPPPCRSDSTHKPSSNCCPTCCQPTCQPVKTKYVIPCYRYEDGRIDQPTVLMRRACEVAAGVRGRRKPFVETSYRADPYDEVHRYHSEDEQVQTCG
ncbi:uncharacterized protein LOC134198691 isoform X3 [Bombyx mori]|uniref:uncharacterized protein LOC134198691 isoform X3 n=1 Tax=Bombyx mori TaxID=7091 RepID=UPI000B3C41F2